MYGGGGGDGFSLVKVILLCCAGPPCCVTVSRSEGEQKDFVAEPSQRLRQTLCSF